MHHVLLVALTGKRDRLTAALQQDRTYVLGSMGGGGGGGGGAGYFLPYLLFILVKLSKSLLLLISSLRRAPPPPLLSEVGGQSPAPQILCHSITKDKITLYHHI